MTNKSNQIITSDKEHDGAPTRIRTSDLQIRRQSSIGLEDPKKLLPPAQLADSPVASADSAQPMSNHGEREHALISGSVVDRGLKCAQSIIKSSEVAPAPSTPEAEEGQKFHELVEQAVETGEFECSDRVMEAHVNTTAQWVVNEINSRNWSEVLLEQRLYVTGDMHGIADCALVDTQGRYGHVIDYKYGLGLVEADSAQLAFYAVALAKTYNLESVKVTLIQPRGEHPDGPIRSMTHSKHELKRWFNRFGLLRFRVLEEPESSPYIPGDHCTYCKAIAVCPEQAKLAKVVTGDFGLKSPKKLTPQEVAFVIQSRTKIEKWLKEVSRHALNSQADSPNPELKIVPGRRSRVWVSQEDEHCEAFQQLGIDPYNHTPKSVAEAEKECVTKEDKALLAKHWKYVPGRPSIAHVSDRRKAVRSAGSKSPFEVVDNTRKQ